MVTNTILEAYGLEAGSCEIAVLGTGLINKTWLIRKKDTLEEFVLQKVNNEVFRRPQDIAYNIRLINDYLKINHPGYAFASPVNTFFDTDMVRDEDCDYFRLFEYVKGSLTLNVLHMPEEAFEAARQFGKFTRLLSGLDVSRLKTTIPDFHNLQLRFQQFNRALKSSAKARAKRAEDAISFLLHNCNIVDTYIEIVASDSFKLRVTHHDTKISNVLFDKFHKGLCVIDLDTVMPGYFISDVGDMMRTYLSPVTEEEINFDKITIRLDFFVAIVKGYLSEMGNELSAVEKKSFVYAGKFMIYMQALRFITDYLEGDVYYKARFSGHNLLRGENQITLLNLFLRDEQHLSALVDDASF